MQLSAFESIISSTMDSLLKEFTILIDGDTVTQIHTESHNRLPAVASCNIKKQLLLNIASMSNIMSSTCTRLVSQISSPEEE